MKTYNIIVIPGDGIGPEIVELTIEVLERLLKVTKRFKCAYEYHRAGGDFYLETGRSISAETFGAIETGDAILAGPVGLPEVRTRSGRRAGLIGEHLRLDFDLFANLRPIRLFPNAPTPLAGKGPGDIDYLIVQQNTEGFILSRNHGLSGPEAATDTVLMTRAGCERITRFAFRQALDRINFAPEDGRRRVTLVDKNDELATGRFFREIFMGIGAEFPDVDAEYLALEEASGALVSRPGHFQVLLTSSMIGDYLGNLGAATVGGQGLGPSAHIGKTISLFNPVHGSDPAMAGLGLANPLSQILSAAMMLDHLECKYEAHLLEKAVWRAMEARQFELAPSGEIVGGSHRVVKVLTDQLKELT